MSEPYMRISVGFYLINRSKNHRGVTQETWTFGKEPVPFSALLAGVVHRALIFYTDTMPNITIDDMNYELAELSKMIGTMKLEAE